MEDKDIVKLFLDNGYQLSGDAITLARSDPTQILKKIEALKPRPLIVTNHHIKKAMTKPRKFVILKKFVPEQRPIKVDDYTKHLMLKYNKIKNILLQRPEIKNLLSINNINPGTTQFSVIAIVKEKLDNEMVLEDPTGTINVIVSGKKTDDIKQEDIILVYCERKGNKIKAKDIFWPDIPINREVTKSKVESKNVVITESLLSDNKKTKYFLEWVSGIKDVTNIFIFANSRKSLPKEFIGFNIIIVGTNNDPNIGMLIENSALIEVDDVKILILTDELIQKTDPGLTTRKNMISLLKKRSLLSKFDPFLSAVADIFVLDDPPDILITKLDEDFYINYKGTTVISMSDPKKARLLDLKTREVVEKEFS